MDSLAIETTACRGRPGGDIDLGAPRYVGAARCPDAGIKLPPVSATKAERLRADDREWWRRVALLPIRPGPVFSALRDGGEEALDRLQEPVTAVAFLAGISLFLSTGTAGRLYDQAGFDPLLVAVEAIVAGALVALQNYWLGGAALLLGLRGLGSDVRYRVARQVVGLSTAPFVLSLVLVWPVRIGIFGQDLFRSGGADEGASGDIFRGIDAALVLWAFLLALVGVRTVERWSWPRSLGATAVAAGLVALLALAALFG